MKITPDLFEAFLKCATKCWLRATGEAASGNTYAEWLKEQNETYRVAETNRLLAQTPPADSALSPLAEHLKAAKWRIAVDILVATPERPRSSRGNEAHSSIAQPSTLNPQPTEMSLLTSAATDQPAAPSTSFTAEARLHAIERIPSEGRGRAARFIPIRFSREVQGAV